MAADARFRDTLKTLLAALDSPEPTRRQKARQIIRDTLAVNQKSWNDLITSLQFRGQHSDKLKKLFAMMENSVPARPIYVPRGKTHIGTCDEDRRTQHRIDIGFVRGVPIEELQQGVDLIVIPTTWKSEKLPFKISEPGRLIGQQDATRLETTLVAGHAGFLVGVWLTTYDAEA
jgi:hypothetical protein